jgi:hypothetical protein
MLRYRVLIDGMLTSRLASTLGAVAIDPQGRRTALHIDVAAAGDLDTVLQRVGDLGLTVVSLEQEPQPA